MGGMGVGKTMCQEQLECTKTNPQYPDYLADNREKLSEEKYAAYNKQCELTRRFFHTGSFFREVYTSLFLI